jgi:hypothetical protein
MLIGGQPRQNRGRVARSGADLENLLAAVELERLADRRDDPGLGDRLALADRKRPVGVGAPAPAQRHEKLARHLRHRREDALVGDPPPSELSLDHRLAAGIEFGAADQKM